MKFIHITDLHLVAAGERLWGLDPLERLRLCFSDVIKYHGDAAFCVISGDLSERGDVASYHALQDALREFKIPTHLMMGNHDDRQNFQSVFGGIGFVQMHWALQGQHFICLDTLKGGATSAGLLDETRRAWLKVALEKTAGAATTIFMHHPPFSIHHPLMDLIALEDGDGFGELIAGHNVRHIFFGHAHRTISGQWRGLSFSALPSLNHQLPLVGGSVPTVYSDEPPMYAVVHLNGTQITVHSDAFMHRFKVDMLEDAERGNWS